MKDKKNLPQMIVLGVLVAVCVGYIGIKFTGKKPAPPPANKKAAAQPESVPVDKPEPAPDVNIPEPTLVAMQVEGTQARRDPFAPTMDIWSRSEITPTQTTKPSVSFPKNPLPLFPAIGKLPVGAGPTRESGGGQENRQPVQPVIEPFPPFVLTGIITGRTNVAIIRLGESRYITKEGQIINGTYKVVTVSQDGVLLNHDGRSVFLKLGGESNAS